MLLAILLSVNALACVPLIRPAPERESAVWGVPLGSAAHDYSAQERVNPEPQLLWRTDAGRASRGAPAIGDEIIAVGTVDRMLTMIERQTGEILWRKRLASALSGGPLVDLDRVYAATEQADGEVYSLRLRDGRVMWHRKLREVSAPPLLMDDGLVAGSEEGWVVCYEAELGSVRWRRRLSGPVRAAPAAYGGLVFVAAEDSLFALDARDGAVRASVRLPGGGVLLAPPAVYRGDLYAGTVTGRVFRLRGTDLSTVWELPVGTAVAGAVAVARDTAFVLTRAGALWRIPVDNALAAEHVEIGGAALAGPTPLAEGVLAGTVSGELLLLDGPRVLWRSRVDGPIEQPPMVRDRMIVVISGKGDVMAFR